MFRHRGEIIDGERRLEICTRYNVPISIREVRASHVWPLRWVLKPEAVTREEFQSKATVAAADCWSDPGTIAAYWLNEEPRDSYRWSRLKVAFAHMLLTAEQGGEPVTAEQLLKAVRKCL